jgi:glutamate formiminotransferase
VEKVVEAVPNFSEGRRPEVIDAIVAAADSHAGAAVLGCEADRDHNRMVVTVAGAPEAVRDAAFSAVSRAAELIDLTGHKGQHPRMGAADVVPFVPISEVSMDECVTLANDLGRRVGEELHIPVFLYGEAATTPDRRNLANVRRGEFEGLRDAMGTDPARNPDFGPSSVHPSAGATAVGARFFLIAFNVYLDTDDVKTAKKIAKEIRESSGGLPGVRALGMYIAERKLAQVSMNLLDYRKTSPAAVVEVIGRMARERGCDVLESEVIGLLPQDALLRSGAEALRINNFGPDMLIEHCLAKKTAARD